MEPEDMDTPDSTSMAIANASDEAIDFLFEVVMAFEGGYDC
jgi:hypothetical protein